MTIEEIKNLDIDGVEKRVAEIRESMSAEDADIDALTAEVDALEERKKSLKKEAEKRAKLTARIANDNTIGKASGMPEMPKENDMTDAEKRAAEFVKTGIIKRSVVKDGHIEKRAILSTGNIAQPTSVSGINDVAVDDTSIIDDVTVVQLTGTGSNKVAWVDTAITAADHTEGTDLTDTDPKLGYTTINPELWSTHTEVSNQIARTTPLQYEQKVEELALVALRAKAAEKVIKAVKASTIAGKTAYALDDDFLTKCFLGYHTIAGMGQVHLYINRADMQTLALIKGTNEKHKLYDIEFDPGQSTTGTIKNGAMSARFTIMEDALLAAGSQIFGQPRTIELDLWNQYEISTNEGGEYFKRDMVGVRGLQSGGAGLCAKNGMIVNTPANA